MSMIIKQICLDYSVMNIISINLVISFIILFCEDYI